ncbi:MAG: DUF6308 family protein [Solirubrobacteraceae bacterium]
MILDDEFTIRVAREDGESLVLAGLTLARAFFEADPSARPGGYDALAGFGHRDRVGVEDVIAMNTTMRSRSKHAWWEPVFASDQRWLCEIPADLDIVEADEDEWKAANGSALLSAAVAACIRPGIGLAGATKLLHLKRPRLVPILDRFVAETIGVSLPDSPTVEQRVAIGQRLATAIRREGRRNLDALRRIQGELVEDDIHRPLIRIFDVVLWFSHPAASVPGARRSIAVCIRA